MVFAQGFRGMPVAETTDCITKAYQNLGIAIVAQAINEAAAWLAQENKIPSNYKKYEGNYLFMDEPSRKRIKRCFNGTKKRLTSSQKNVIGDGIIAMDFLRNQTNLDMVCNFESNYLLTLVNKKVAVLVGENSNE